MLQNQLKEKDELIRQLRERLAGLCGRSGQEQKRWQQRKFPQQQWQRQQPRQSCTGP
ncbi:hypothetical protein DIPPA_15882 [Diplonema papillatum]|nr:hypothetical protein DIPPA_34628 [Diplonema papillatum]KAJ9441685.1 hypothetical protein DIPPA_15882 [Diplonema papillatum]